MADKRISKPQHIRQIIGEQINDLRKNDFPEKTEIDKARAIGYLSSVALTAMKDGELEERISAIEKSLKESD